MSHDLLDFLKLTEEGRKLFADPESYYQPFKGKYDPLPQIEWNPKQEAVEKFIMMLNILYWDKLDHLVESISHNEFCRTFFSQYFTLEAALVAILRVKFGTAPIWGLYNFIKTISNNFKTFPVKL